MPYDEILDNLQGSRDALHGILDAVCRALSSAYDQVTLLSSGGTVERLVKVLLRLAKQFGWSSGHLVEVDASLTQEEISHMMASSREKVSVALNLANSHFSAFTRTATPLIGSFTFPLSRVLRYVPGPSAMPSPNSRMHWLTENVSTLRCRLPRAPSPGVRTSHP